MTQKKQQPVVVWIEIAEFLVNTEADGSDVFLDDLRHTQDEFLDPLVDLTARNDHDQIEFVLGVVHLKGFGPNFLIGAKNRWLAQE